MKYPIGPYNAPEIITEDLFSGWIARIEILPYRLNQTISNISSDQLNHKTSPGIWSIAQVIHHIADSHMNAYTRVKLALTEDTPTIKPYDESQWAKLPDSNQIDIQGSLQMIAGIHNRFSFLLRNLTEAQRFRSYYHPENKKNYRVEEVPSLYAWHGDHHLAFISEALK